MYDKWDDFDFDNFDIVNFPFLDGDVPRRTSYAVYISQLIRFARASSKLSDFNYRNKALTAELLRQGYRYFKLRKNVSKFYRRHSALVEKYRRYSEEYNEEMTTIHAISCSVYRVPLSTISLTFDTLTDADFGLPDLGSFSVDSNQESNFFVHLRTVS